MKGVKLICNFEAYLGVAWGLDFSSPSVEFWREWWHGLDIRLKANESSGGGDDTGEPQGGQQAHECLGARASGQRNTAEHLRSWEAAERGILKRLRHWKAAMDTGHRTKEDLSPEKALRRPRHPGLVSRKVLCHLEAICKGWESWLFYQ